MNARAVKWINRAPFRWAGYGALVATALSAAHTVSVYLGLMPRPTDMSVAGFLVLMWLLLVVVFAMSGAISGWLARTLLLRFTNDDDATAKAKTRSLPLWFAGGASIFVLLSAVGTYFENLGTTTEYPLALPTVVGIAVGAAAIAWLIGLVLRSALHKRLLPGVSGPSVPMLANVAPVVPDAPERSTFATAWYATAERVGSVSKIYASEDRGALTIEGDMVRFAGRKQVLAIRGITDARVAGQRPSWTVPILVLVIGVLATLLAGSIEGGRSLVSSLGLPLALAVFVFYASAKVKWVRISYRGTDGTAREAYFADGSNYGWGGIGGGTQRLCDAVVRMMRAEPTRTEPTTTGTSTARRPEAAAEIKHSAS